MEKCEIIEALNYSIDFSLDTLNVSSIHRHSLPADCTDTTMAPKVSSSELTKESIADLLTQNNAKIVADLKQTITSEINKAVGTIKTDLAVVKTDVSSHTTKIGLLEARCASLETEVRSLRATEARNIAQISSELEDRRRRACNIMILGALESNSENQAENLQIDRENTFKVLVYWAPELQPDDICFLTRLGKRSPQKPRPLKIVLSNPEFAKKIFKGSKLAPAPGIKIVNDLTPAQKQELEDLRVKLQALNDDTKTIRYIRGTPQIAPKPGNANRQ